MLSQLHDSGISCYLDEEARIEGIGISRQLAYQSRKTAYSKICMYCLASQRRREEGELLGQTTWVKTVAEMGC